MPSGEGCTTRRRGLGGRASHQEALLWYDTIQNLANPLLVPRSEQRDLGQPSSHPELCMSVHLLPAEEDFWHSAGGKKKESRLPLSTQDEYLYLRLGFLHGRPPWNKQLSWVYSEYYQRWRWQKQKWGQARGGNWWRGIALSYFG